MTETSLIALPFFLLASAVVIMAIWRQNGPALRTLAAERHNGRLHLKLPGTAALLGLWLLLTLLSLWCAAFTSYVGVHVLLFLLGPAAAWAGVIAAAALMVSIPFAWGWAILSLGEATTGVCRGVGGTPVREPR